MRCGPKRASLEYTTDFAGWPRIGPAADLLVVIFHEAVRQPVYWNEYFEDHKTCNGCGHESHEEHNKQRLNSG